MLSRFIIWKSLYIWCYFSCCSIYIRSCKILISILINLLCFIINSYIKTVFTSFIFFRFYNNFRKPF
nr:MAG TPA: hypothetical protein [Bacteriophage sp.]